MNTSSEVDNATARAAEPVAGLSQEEISNQLLFVIEGVVLGSVACLGIAGDVETCKQTITRAFISSYTLYSRLLFFHGSKLGHYGSFMVKKFATNGVSW